MYHSPDVSLALFQGVVVASEARLAAVAEAARHEFPTADIDIMLRKIESGRGLS